MRGSAYAAPLAPHLKEACDRACARTFACTAVDVRGRCEGVPICVERGVIFPMGCHKESRWRKDQWRKGGFKQRQGQRQNNPPSTSPQRHLCVVILLIFFSPQNAEQQQHQQHPCFQLQPHAQTTNLVSLIFRFLSKARHTSSFLKTHMISGGMNVLPGRLWETAIATDLHGRVCNNCRGHYTPHPPHNLKHAQQ